MALANIAPIAKTDGELASTLVMTSCTVYSPPLPADLFFVVFWLVASVIDLHMHMYLGISMDQLARTSAIGGDGPRNAETTQTH